MKELHDAVDKLVAERDGWQQRAEAAENSRTYLLAQLAELRASFGSNRLPGRYEQAYVAADATDTPTFQRARAEKAEKSAKEWKEAFEAQSASAEACTVANEVRRIASRVSVSGKAGEACYVRKLADGVAMLAEALETPTLKVKLLTLNVDAKVEPGNHSDFEIYIESTSANRIGVRGSFFLHDFAMKVSRQPTWDHEKAAADAAAKKLAQANGVAGPSA